MPQTPAEKLEQEQAEMPLPVAVATVTKIGKELMQEEDKDD